MSQSPRPVSAFRLVRPVEVALALWVNGGWIMGQSRPESRKEGRPEMINGYSYLYSVTSDACRVELAGWLAQTARTLGQ